MVKKIGSGIRIGRLLASADEYESALARIEALLDRGIVSGTSDEAELDYLSLLVEDFDRRHYRWPDARVSPQEVVAFLLEQHGMTRSALADIMGGRSRVSEFFSGKRPLSLGQVVALRRLLGAPADLLIADSSGGPAGTVPYAARRTGRAAGHRTPRQRLVKEDSPRYYATTHRGGVRPKRVAPKRQKP